MLPRKMSGVFSIFGSGEVSKDSSTRREVLPTLKLEIDKEVYRPGDSVVVNIVISNPVESENGEGLRNSTCSLLIERLTFEVKGIEKLDTQWFSTQKSLPGSKQKRGEHVFMDCSTPAIVTNQIVSSGDNKTYVVRMTLPSSIPPSYKGSTIRYLYYVRSTLSAQWLILEKDQSQRESVKDPTQIEARTPLQIWVPQKSSGLQSDDAQNNAMYLLMCHFGTISACTKLPRDSTIASLRSFVLSRWSELSPDFGMGYLFKVVTSYCEIKTEDDYQTMFEVANSLNTTLITIKIVPSSLVVPNISMSSDPSNRSTSTDSLSILSSGDSSCNDGSREVDAIEDSVRFEMVSRWKYFITGIHQEFEGGALEFRDALKFFSLFAGFEYVYRRNNDFRIKAVCKYSNAGRDPNFPEQDTGCQWMIMASGGGNSSTFYIRKYIPTHTCGASAITRTNPRFSSKIVSEIVLEKLHDNEMYSAIELVKDMSKQYGFDISYTKAWNAIERANALRFGQYKESYEQLRRYCIAASGSNPFSHISFEEDDDHRFLRVFVSFNACIQGFNHCRPMLFCDSTFLKGRYRGQMFAATAKDGNNQLFPIAYAIVNSENKENWEWFFRHLNEIISPDRVITFISDRNEGLLHGVSTVFPWSPHGYCIEHLKKNLKVTLSGRPSEFKVIMQKLFYKVIFATDPSHCQRKLEKMKKLGGIKVAAFLDGIELKHYSDPYFQGERFGEMTSNAAESFNSMFRNERGLPLTGLVDAIRVKLMSDMATKRDIAAQWTSPLSPRVDTLLTERLQLGRLWQSIKCTEFIYEVRDKRSVSVDFHARTCTCLKWQQHKLPCAHALCAILKSGLPLASFIELWYHTQTVRDTYALPIMPVATLNLTHDQDEEMSPVKPPSCKRQPGRPKTHRIPSSGESSTRPITCSRCGRQGHNRKGCREAVHD